MERNNIIGFIRNNYIAIAIGCCFFAYYVYSAVAGNRICDCEKTEKYGSSTARSGINRFYHK